MHTKQLPDLMFASLFGLQRRQSRLGRGLVSSLLALAMLLMNMAFPQTAQAATFVVTAAGNAGPGTLRQAILDANQTTDVNDSITFAANLTGPITLTAPLIVSDDVTISGPGKALLSIELGSTATLQISDSISTNFIAVSISGLSLIGTGTTDGAITTLENLTLEDVAISSACSKYGAVHAYDPNYNDANKPAITIRSTTFSGNLCNGLDAAAGALFTEAANVLIENSTFSGNSGYWAGAINTWDGNLTVNGTAITNNTTDYYGAGISTNYNSLLEISGSTISNNTAGLTGGGIYSYYATGPFTLQNSSVTGNSAGYVGGGVAAYRYDVPLATPARSTSAGKWQALMEERLSQPRAVAQEPICQSPVTTPMNNLTDSRIIKLLASDISNNNVTKPPQIDNPGSGGGVYLEEVQAEIQGTKISGNSVTGYGGGVAACASPLAIHTSTLSGNSAQQSGGGAAISLAGSATLLQNTTISGNNSLTGGGAYLYKTSDVNLKLLTLVTNTATTSGAGVDAATGTGASNRAAMVENSIIAKNTVGGVGQDLATSTALISLAYSLLQAPGSATISNPPGSGNLLGQDPLLGVLQNNGGATFTHLPAGNSPAVNTGNPAFTAPPAADQRGSTRVVNGRVDMGAVEVQLSAGSLALSPTSLETVEGSKTVSFSVTRSGGSEGAVSVAYSTSSGTATADADYTAASGSLSWNSGELGSKTISVTLLDDKLDEASETVYLTLSSATGGATISAALATLTILDNDEPGSLSFTVTSLQTLESYTTVAFTVARSGGFDGVVSVNVTASSGTATSDLDFSPAFGTLVWADGEQGSKTFTVTIFDDLLDEPDETINLTLSAATGGAAIGTTNATLTILDNDFLLWMPFVTVDNLNECYPECLPTQPQKFTP